MKRLRKNERRLGGAWRASSGSVSLSGPAGPGKGGSCPRRGMPSVYGVSTPYRPWREPLLARERIDHRCDAAESSLLEWTETRYSGRISDGDAPLQSAG